MCNDLELRNFYISSNIIRVTTLGTMQQAIYLERNAAEKCIQSFVPRHEERNNLEKIEINGKTTLK